MHPASTPTIIIAIPFADAKHQCWFIRSVLCSAMLVISLLDISHVKKGKLLFDFLENNVLLLKTIYEILDHYLFTRRYRNEGWDVKYSCCQFIQQTNQLGQCEQSVSASDCRAIWLRFWISKSVKF